MSDPFYIFPVNYDVIDLGIVNDVVKDVGFDAGLQCPLSFLM